MAFALLSAYWFGFLLALVVAWFVVGLMIGLIFKAVNVVLPLGQHLFRGGFFVSAMIFTSIALAVIFDDYQNNTLKDEKKSQTLFRRVAVSHNDFSIVFVTVNGFDGNAPYEGNSAVQHLCKGGDLQVSLKQVPDLADVQDKAYLNEDYLTLSKEGKYFLKNSENNPYRIYCGQ